MQSRKSPCVVSLVWHCIAVQRTRNAPMGCPQAKTLCLDCRIPLCRRCQLTHHRNEIVSVSAGNGYGCFQPWIYQVGVTWMENTVATQ